MLTAGAAIAFAMLAFGLLAGCSFRVPADADAASQLDMALQLPSPQSDLATLPEVRDLARPIVRDLEPPPDLEPPNDMTPWVVYQTKIQSILDNRGCTTAVCHQAYNPLVIPQPATSAQWGQNWRNVSALADPKCDMATAQECAAQSLLLLKPLAGDGVDHGGGAAGTKPFASATDPDYQSILLWIEEGARAQ